MRGVSGMRAATWGVEWWDHRHFTANVWTKQRMRRNSDVSRLVLVPGNGCLTSPPGLVMSRCAVRSSCRRSWLHFCELYFFQRGLIVPPESECDDDNDFNVEDDLPRET